MCRVQPPSVSLLIKSTALRLSSSNAIGYATFRSIDFYKLLIYIISCKLLVGDSSATSITNEVMISGILIFSTIGACINIYLYALSQLDLPILINPNFAFPSQLCSGSITSLYCHQAILYHSLDRLDVACDISFINLVSLSTTL